MEFTTHNTIKYTLIGFLLSFTLIFYLDNNHELSTKNISDLSLKDLNKNVKIEGRILKQNLIKDHLFLTINDGTSSIKVIGFYAKEELYPYSQYIIEGKITLYEKELEIIANKIEIKP